MPLKLYYLIIIISDCIILIFFISHDRKYSILNHVLAQVIAHNITSYGHSISKIKLCTSTGYGTY